MNISITFHSLNPLFSLSHFPDLCLIFKKSALGVSYLLTYNLLFELFIFWVISIRESNWCLIFSFWFISLTIIVIRSIFLQMTQISLFIPKQYFIVYIHYISLYMHLSRLFYDFIYCELHFYKHGYVMYCCNMVIITLLGRYPSMVHLGETEFLLFLGILYSFP